MAPTITEAQDAITAVYPRHQLRRASGAKGAPTHVVTGGSSGICGRAIPEASPGFSPGPSDSQTTVCSSCLSIVHRKGSKGGSRFSGPPLFREGNK